MALSFEFSVIQELALCRIAARLGVTDKHALMQVLVDAALGGAGVIASPPDSELIDIFDVCRRLRLTVWTVRRRARTPGDPLRLAKSKIGKKKPMQFCRSKIELLERGLQR